jgi:hypothetical protein
MRFVTRKRAALLLAALVALGLALGAYAYFTSTGQGSGSATVGSAANEVYVSGVAGGTLLPGGSPSTVTLTAKNFASSTESISTIHLTGIQACVAAWTAADTSSWPVAAPTCADTGSDAASDAACDTSSSTGTSNDTSKAFWMSDVTLNATSASDGMLAGSSSHVLDTSGTITMNNLSTSQDACQGKHLLLTFTAS